MPVIIVPMSDNVTSCLLTGQIALASDRQPIRYMVIADAFICWHQIANSVAPIVDDDQLFVGIILAQKVLNGVLDEGTTITGWHDATH